MIDLVAGHIVFELLETENRLCRNIGLVLDTRSSVFNSEE